MIFNFLFSRYFIFTLVSTSLIAILHGNDNHWLSITAFISTFIISTIGLYGFMQNKPLSEILHIFFNRKSDFSFKVFVNISFSLLLGSLLFGDKVIDSTIDGYIFNISLTFISIIFIQVLSLNWTQFAVKEKGLSFHQIIYIFDNHNYSIIGFSILFTGFDFIFNSFINIMILSIFLFFFYFVPSNFFNEENK
tara:strand:+ start:4842 stop:5420 length:579 start_codon:yes stop_codon:yes gene_type:complete